MKVALLILCLLSFQEWPDYVVKQEFETECQDRKCTPMILRTTILKRGKDGNHYRFKSWEDTDTSKVSVEVYKKFAEEWIERDKAKAQNPPEKPQQQQQE